MEGGSLGGRSSGSSTVVVMDLVVEVVDMVAEGFKNNRKGTAVLRRDSEELSGKLQVTLRQWTHMH
jgi:hypothetical protein